MANNTPLSDSVTPLLHSFVVNSLGKMNYAIPDAVKCVNVIFSNFQKSADFEMSDGNFDAEFLMMYVNRVYELARKKDVTNGHALKSDVQKIYTDCLEQINKKYFVRQLF